MSWLLFYIEAPNLNWEDNVGKKCNIYDEHEVKLSLYHLRNYMEKNIFPFLVFKGFIFKKYLSLFLLYLF